MTGVSVGTCCNWISTSTVHPTVHATIILIIFAVCYFSCPSLPAGCREAATAGIKFTQRPKIRFFARLIAPIHVKLGVAGGHLGPLGCAKFYLKRRRGGRWECSPKYQNVHFLVVTPQGRSPWPISKIFRGFYTPNYATSVFQIWHDSLHRLRSYCWETTSVGQLGRFLLHPVGKKYALDQKMNGTFLMASTSSITMQSLG